MLTAILVAALLLAPATPAAQEKPKPSLKPEIVILDPEAPKPDPATDGSEPVEYAFNPHQAKKEMDVGEFYMRKGSHAAAVLRFERALRWHPKLAPAYLRLGAAAEKSGELQKALEAYRKYLELDPKGKKTRDAQKSIARLEKELKD